MPLLRSAWTLHWLYFTVLNSTFSTMALLHSTSVYIILLRFYFTPLALDSTLLYLHSASLYFTLPSHYFTLHYSTMALLHSTMALFHSIWLYITLLCLNFIALDSTLLFHGSISLYLTLLYSTMAQHHSTWFYLTLYSCSTLYYTWLCYGSILHSTWLYITIQWLLFYQGSTSPYLSLHYSSMALLSSNWLYFILPWLYFTLVDST